MKAVKETHMYGILSIERDLRFGGRLCDVGIQIAEDGRIWICVDGEALLRFKPFLCEEKTK